jgi:cation:H+ antiporter
MGVDALALPVLLGIFALAAAVVWVAGVKIADVTDVLDDRFDLGEALGGMVLLALVTNLPEVAIVSSAALRGSMDIAIGNILGGIAIQTVVLAVLDLWGLGRIAALTCRVDAPALLIEGVLVIAVLALTVMGHLLPADMVYMRMTPIAVLILLAWISGIYVIGHARKTLQTRTPKTNKPRAEGSTAHYVLVFGVCALATLGAGVVLEISGEAIARSIGMTGAVFAATVLAAATSMPEVATGLRSVRNGNYELAVSDIFGGNAFLPVLFLLATLLSGESVLPAAKPTDIYLTGLGIMLTCVYLSGLVLRSKRQWWRMGIDSWLVMMLYALGVVGLFFVT